MFSISVISAFGGDNNKIRFHFPKPRQRHGVEGETLPLDST